MPSKSLKEKRINRKTQKHSKKTAGDGTNMEPSKKTKDRAVGEWRGHGSGHRRGFPEGCAHLATASCKWAAHLWESTSVQHRWTGGLHMISSNLTGCVCGV